MLLALIILVITLTIVVAAVGKALTVEMRRMHGLIWSNHEELTGVPDGPSIIVDPPLVGLRVALSITQDHPHNTFVELLKEQLFASDATDVVVLQPTDAFDIWNDENGADLLIKGKVVCNGYSEIYYEADFSCSNKNGAICTLIEKPPHGDRPNNLAIELIARLKTELEKLISRNERRAAIKELRN